MMGSMDAELEWLLADHIPPIMQNISALINDGLKAASSSPTITTSTRPAPGSPQKPGSTLAVTSPNSDIVKGFVTVDGTNIIKGDLTLKLPNYSRGASVKVAIAPSKPYKLSQMQNVRNQLVVALDAYESFDHAHYERTTLLLLLKRILKTMKDAANALKSAKEESLFPIKECDVKLFTPDLPEDLIVEFYVNKSNLVVAVYGLSFQQAVAAIPIDFQNKIISRFRNLKTNTYKGKSVEVMDEIIVESHFPAILQVSKNVSSIASLCESMINQLQATMA